MYALINVLAIAYRAGRIQHGGTGRELIGVDLHPQLSTAALERTEKANPVQRPFVMVGGTDRTGQGVRPGRRDIPAGSY